AHSDESVAPETGHGSKSRRASSRRSENRVDERRERLDRRRQNQHQPEHAQEHGKRDEPPVAGFTAPQAAREIGDRAAGAGEGDQTAPDAAAFSDDHATPSLSGLAGAAAGFMTSTGPAASTSMPQ